LAGPGRPQAAAGCNGPHATAHGQRHEALFGRSRHDVEDGLAIVRRGGDVQEAKFVRARRIISPRGLHWITRIHQVNEVDALDDAAVLYVQTRYDTGLQGHWIAVLPSSAPRRLTSNLPTTEGTSPLESTIGS